MIVLTILLTILKILGITLLVLLGLVLLLVLLILFAPLRYKVEAEKYEKLKVNARVRWCFPLIQARFLMEEGSSLCLRVLGIPIFRKSMGKDEEPDEAKIEAEDDPYAVDEKGDLKHPEKLEELRSSVEESKQQISDEVSKTQIPTEVVETQTPKEAETTETTEKPNVEETSERIETAEAEKTEVTEPSVESGSLEAEDSSEDEESISEEEPKKKRFAKLFAIKDKVNSYKEAGQAMLTLFSRKKEILVKYMTKDRTKRVLAMLWKYLKKILKHLCPKKLEGTMVFGSGDPETTGKVTAMVSVIYAMVGPTFSFVPDFEEKKIEGQVLVKGRITLGVLLWYAVRIWFNKDFKKAKKEAFCVKDKMVASVDEAKDIIHQVA